MLFMIYFNGLLTVCNVFFQKKKKYQDFDNMQEEGSGPPGEWQGFGAFGSPKHQHQQQQHHNRGGRNNDNNDSNKSPPGPYDSPYQSPRGPYDSPGTMSEDEYGPPPKLHRYVLCTHF